MKKYIHIIAGAAIAACSTAAFAADTPEITKKVLVEEFTTELCPNCPRVATWIHNTLETIDYADDVIVLCHHAGYYTDWLTLPFHTQLTWFYNDGGRTYAPALMVDRRTSGGVTPVKNFSSQSDMELDWRYKVSYAPKVSLDIEARLDSPDADCVQVKVTGFKNVETVCESPRMTVWVVEDNVAAKAQAGGGNSFVHQHVTRATNLPFGEFFPFDGDDYEYSCTLPLDPSWKKENLSIVASISNYTVGKPAECPVINSNKLPYEEFTIDTSGIGLATEEATDAPAEFYTLSGVRVDGGNPAPGLYVKVQGGKAQKVLVK